MLGGKDYGLYQCILGRGTDLCSDADTAGQDEADARKNHGASVCSGSVLGAFKIYPVIQDFAGAGASVPLLGFGNLLWKGVKEAVEKEGFIGIFMGGFKASAVGISAALIFGYLASLIFEPKMKK